MKLVILIPALNEEKTIQDVIAAIPAEFDRITDREIVVIDDGSSDKTRLLAESSGGRATGKDIYFSSKEDPDYQELLEILREAKAAIDENPRMDMPGGRAIRQERNFGRTF